MNNACNQEAVPDLQLAIRSHSVFRLNLGSLALGGLLASLLFLALFTPKQPSFDTRNVSYATLQGSEVLVAMEQEGVQQKSNLQQFASDLQLAATNLHHTGGVDAYMYTFRELIRGIEKECPGDGGGSCLVPGINPNYWPEKHRPRWYPDKESTPIVLASADFYQTFYTALKEYENSEAGFPKSFTCSQNKKGGNAYRQEKRLVAFASVSGNGRLSDINGNSVPETVYWQLDCYWRDRSYTVLRPFEEGGMYPNDFILRHGGEGPYAYYLDRFGSCGLPRDKDRGCGWGRVYPPLISKSTLLLEHDKRALEEREASDHQRHRGPR